MNFTKRIVVLLLIVAIGVLGFCGGTGEQKQTSTLDGAIKKVVDDKVPVEISFWTGTGAANYPYLEKMVNNFMMAYPNIKVDFSNQGAINDLTVKLTQNIVSKTTPTISNINAPTFPEYIASGAIIDLAPYLNDSRIGLSATQQADIFPNYFEEVKSFGPAGTMYGWPTNKKTTDVLVYNKTFFDAHGWDAPKTWTEVAAYSKLIKEETGKPGFSYDISYGEGAFKTMSSQWGSPYITADGVIDINNPQGLDALLFYKENLDKGYFTLPPLMPSAGGNYSNAGFVMEECYMFIGPAAGIQYSVPFVERGHKDFEVGVAALPQKDLTKAVTFGKGENYAVFSNSTTEQRVAAWLLITYLTEAENNIEWLIKTGNLPISSSQVNNPEYQAFLSSTPKDGNVYNFAISVNAALEMMDYMRYDIAIDNADKLAEKVGSMFRTVLIGGADPATTLAATAGSRK
jgi:multiple sugar transport system substrate-binding protein